MAYPQFNVKPLQQGAFQTVNFGKPNASIGLSAKISFRVFSSGTQSSIMSRPYKTAKNIVLWMPLLVRKSRRKI
jgi:hypothetical protein